jgi:drug/metabolite transporter (DMT)-like permease
MAILLALAAALLFAGGTVLQQKVAATASGDEALKAGFLLRLARRPVWLAGIGLDAAGFVCQAIALGIGRLVVVQPILATSVVFALPLGNRLSGQHIHRREVVAAVAVTAGLGVFLVVADPSGGRDDATTTAWIVSFAVIAVLCAGLVGAGSRAGPAGKATLFGIATGVLFGLSAALTKAVVERLDDGVLAVAGDWQLYALIVVGWVSMTLSQASLQTGRLAPAMATQMVLDPITSVLLGTLAFDERIHTSPAGLAGSLAAIAVMLGGLVVLASAAPPGEAQPPSSSESAANRAVV